MQEVAGKKMIPYVMRPRAPRLASRSYTFHMLVLAPICEIHICFQEQRPFDVCNLISHRAIEIYIHSRVTKLDTLSKKTV